MDTKKRAELLFIKKAQETEEHEYEDEKIQSVNHRFTVDVRL